MSKLGFARFAAAALCGYFIIFGSIFIINPGMAADLGVKAINPAGVTEIRAYYGALSIALGLFLVRSFLRKEYETSITLGWLLCGCVVSSRTVGSFIDGAFSEPYTLFAIPAELGMFAALSLALWCVKTAKS